MPARGYQTGAATKATGMGEVQQVTDQLYASRGTDSAGLMPPPRASARAMGEAVPGHLQCVQRSPRVDPAQEESGGFIGYAHQVQ